MKRVYALILALVSQLLNPANAQLSEIEPLIEVAGTMPSRPKVALVLSGGSAYGLAHIGVIKVLEEMGIPVDIVVGTSMGAIVGGFYAMGYNADELRGIVDETDWVDLFDEDTESEAESFMYMTDRSRYAAALRFDKKGFTISTGYLTGHKMLRFIDSISLSVPSSVNFDDLPRKFRAVATDISNGELVILSEGSLSEAMRSSASVPGMFAPYFLNGRYLVDGCIVDNLPIDLARSMGADIVIAVDLFNGTPFNPEIDNRSPISSLSRSFDILVYANVQRQLARADLVIPVDMAGYLTSDFEKSGEIMEVGEQSARKVVKELSDISALEKLDPEYEVDFPKHIAFSPPIKKIIVSGVSEKRSSQIQKLFEGLIDTVPDVVTLQTIFQKIDSSGNKDTLRIKRDFTQSDRPLVITMTEKKHAENLLRVNFSYEASFSKALISDLDLVPALSVPGLTTLDSRLLIDVELFDAPSFDIRFIQPLNPSLYISPFIVYLQEFDTQISAKTGVLQTRTVSQTAGLRLAKQMAYGIELNFGWSYDCIGDLIFREVNGEDPVVNLSVIRAGIDINRVDSPIFPMNGILTSVDALLTRPEIGSTLSFATIETRSSVFSSFNTPLSVGLLWKAGTVFADRNDDTQSVPSVYKPDLSGRRMFPGPLNVEERIGTHVVGFGIELKYNVNRDSPGIAFPIFILMHGAVGTVINDAHSVDSILDACHWNSTAGIGIKISNAFGVAFRGGILQRTDKSFIPFIALDIGSIAYK